MANNFPLTDVELLVHAILSCSNGYIDNDMHAQVAENELLRRQKKKHEQSVTEYENPLEPPRYL
ncbi:hypothetical protein CMI47_13195 [Candidatus Pacearchaeota archaeon]|nr:hypothetical protein [Candidatus Pacearchaeota archaeon]